MADREIVRRLADLEAQVADLRRQLGNIPVRFGGGGAGGDSLPPGSGRGKVLTLLDDLDPATVGWDWARFWDVPADEIEPATTG